MITSTAQLREVYPQIIDRLDHLYSIGLNQALTDAEQAEIAELRQRARLIDAELSQRRQSAPLFA